MTKPIRFEMADLKLYVTIIEQGSLSKAAKTLPLALSATSARLKALEDRLEIQLVERSARGVKATVAGQHFYDHAVRLVKAAQEAQLEMDAISGKGRLRIKLSSNVTGLSTELPRQLSEFLEQNPNMDIDLLQQASRDAHNAVASGRADLAIVDRDYTNQELLYLLYQRNQLVVIANSSSSCCSKTLY